MYYTDVFKSMLLQTDYFKDNLTTHFTASLGAGTVATILTQPFDVLKTRAMNAKPGDFKNPLELITTTAKQGPMTFYKGFVPAWVRLGPHMILTFTFYEQLRLSFFGYHYNRTHEKQNLNVFIFYIMIQVAVLYHIPRLEGLIKQAIQQINLTF